MTKDIWINLPVKDVNKSRGFYTAMGFTLNPGLGNNENMGCFFVGEKKVVLMLIEEKMFKGFTQNNLTDTKQSTEVLISIDAENREEVNEMAKKAEAAGGIVFGKPAENQGWMYGCGFTDLDGHRWNVLHMDFSKMPK